MEGSWDRHCGTELYWSENRRKVGGCRYSNVSLIDQSLGLEGRRNILCIS